MKKIRKESKLTTNYQKELARSAGSGRFNVGHVSEKFMNEAQMHAVRDLYDTNPSMKAARNVLHARMLSGGISLVRDGETVELTSTFRKHVEEYWMPFAHAIIDNFLMFGLCVVVYDLVDDGLNASKSDAHKQRDDPTSNVVPVVPHIGSYSISYVYQSRNGYLRKYKIYNKERDMVEDVNARVHVRHAPDNEGNINSPMSSIFETGYFLNTIMDLALRGETQRVHNPLVTQARRMQSSAGISVGDMYFDRESEQAANEQQEKDNQRMATDLKTQLELCTYINNLQTRSGMGIPSNAAPKHVPEIASRLFTLPTDQEIAQFSHPEARRDLTDIIRMCTDHMCSAIGVPSSLIFESRHADYGAQLSLLNATVQQLTDALNSVLTSAYTDIYGSNNSKETLQLVANATNSTSTDAVIKMYTSGLADFEVAAPISLHTIGATATEIEAAMQRHKDRMATQEYVRNQTADPKTSDSTRVDNDNETEDTTLHLKQNVKSQKEEKVKDATRSDTSFDELPHKKT